MQATTKTTKEADEYRVRLFINGEYQPGADYFTDNKADAKKTATAMIKKACCSDKSTPVAIEELEEYQEDCGFYAFTIGSFLDMVTGETTGNRTRRRPQEKTPNKERECKMGKALESLKRDWEDFAAHAPSNINNIIISLTYEAVKGGPVAVRDLCEAYQAGRLPGFMACPAMDWFASGWGCWATLCQDVAESPWDEEEAIDWILEMGGTPKCNSAEVGL